MKIWVGHGENNFTMSRGSFRYRQKQGRLRRLTLCGVTQAEGGQLLEYTDETTGAQHRIRVQQRGDKTTAEYIGEPPADVNRYRISIRTDPAEHIYGCGENYSKLNLKGEKVRIWVAEHQNTGRITRKIIREKLTGKHPQKRLPFSQYESYYAQPTFTSSGRYYLHLDTTAYAELDFTVPDKITLNTQQKPRFVVERAPTFAELSDRLSQLLGRQGALPGWIYDGAILAVQGGTAEIERKLARADAAGVQTAGIWSQDWCGCRKTDFGYQVMWNWQWDAQLYPDLPRKIAEWQARGVRFLGYINPFIALEGELYRTAAENGYCVKDSDGKDYLVTITTFPSAMVDFTNPQAYSWYKGIIKQNMIGLGMGGWMADFGEYLPVDAVLYSGESAELLHNRWPAIWAKMNAEAIAECGKQDEVFFFTRAGYTGTIGASAMMWTGDQHVDWSVDDGLPSVIPATLSLAMSGYGITHSDAGGYTTIMHMRRSRELLRRWVEMNAFSPLLRTHEGNQPANNVQFDDDEQLLAQMAKFSRIHAGLKPYLMACVEAQRQHGTPVMRPLFYHYDEAPAYDEMTEYLLGRDILVAPVITEGAVSRSCYLPQDCWVHLFSGAEYGGGVHTVDAPIGQPPVFIRRGCDDFDSLMALAK